VVAGFGDALAVLFEIEVAIQLLAKGCGVVLGDHF
jgi:hypothetical protein